MVNHSYIFPSASISHRCQLATTLRSSRNSARSRSLGSEGTFRKDLVVDHSIILGAALVKQPWSCSPIDEVLYHALHLVHCEAPQGCLVCSPFVWTQEGAKNSIMSPKDVNLKAKTHRRMGFTTSEHWCESLGFAWWSNKCSDFLASNSQVLLSKCLLYLHFLHSSNFLNTQPVGNWCFSK